MRLKPTPYPSTVYNQLYRVLQDTPLTLPQQRAYLMALACFNQYGKTGWLVPAKVGSKTIAFTALYRRGLVARRYRCANGSRFLHEEFQLKQ